MAIGAVLESSLAQTSPLVCQTNKDSPARIQKSASDFEALLLNQMLRSAREAGGSGFSGLGGEDDPNSTLVELGEQQFAQALAASGGFGIAKMVVAGLTKHAH